jgi:putative transposase
MHRARTREGIMAHRYDPEIHHRRSIRLKGHDYAGGGTYFVTMCAHREFRDACGGTPFVSSAREVIESEWRKTAALRPYVHLDEHVVMPDHFHGLMRLDAGGASLGEVIGAFKAAVSRGMRRGEMHLAHTGGARHHAHAGRIWHRNYYERIIRNEEELVRVQRYIRTNPWKNVIHFGDGMRGIGNPTLWNCKKLGMLCSRDCPADTLAASEEQAMAYSGQNCLLSGFHSAPEKAVLASLLRGKARVICCPAWGVDKMKIPAEWLPALEQNRMLILAMKNEDGDLMAARERNVFVMNEADEMWMPHVSPGGMLAGLVGRDASRPYGGE